MANRVAKTIRNNNKEVVLWGCENHEMQNKITLKKRVKKIPYFT